MHHRLDILQALELVFEDFLLTNIHWLCIQIWVKEKHSQSCNKNPVKHQ